MRIFSLGSLLSQEKLLGSVEASRIPEPAGVGECPVPATVASGGQVSSVTYLENPHGQRSLVGYSP